MNRAADLRAAYDLLWVQLQTADAKSAAGLVREYRLLGAELDRLEAGGVSFVDELAAKRAGAGSSRRSGRRKSG